MKTKIKPLILLLCILAMPASAQENIKKFGIGLGYHSASIVGDSVRPFDISFRYRINERHTLTLYAPLLKTTKKLSRKITKFLRMPGKKTWTSTRLLRNISSGALA